MRAAVVGGVRGAVGGLVSLGVHLLYANMEISSRHMNTLEFSWDALGVGSSWEALGKLLGSSWEARGKLLGMT